MPWFDENKSNTNFMIIGNSCAGAGLLHHCLRTHPEIVCHIDLLHENEKIRKAEHESYFGDSAQAFDWFVPAQISAEQYLANKIFDNNLRDEKTIGVTLTYADVAKYDLWHFIDQMYRIGDFYLIHVTRNPVACFLVQELNKSRLKRNLDINEAQLIKFVRDHLAFELKINELVADKVVLPYHELIMDYTGVMSKLLPFMEVNPNKLGKPKLSVVQQNLRSSISNLNWLRDKLPGDVLEQLDSFLLF
jgi:hypothetical protein